MTQKFRQKEFSFFLKELLDLLKSKNVPLCFIFFLDKKPWNYQYHVEH